jgi:hypothetical protein
MYCLFCVEDIRNTLRRECPFCKKLLEVREPSLLTKNQLGREVLKGCPINGCIKSDTRMTYEQVKTHIERDCAQLNVECPKNCGVYVQRDALTTHLEEECPNFIEYCLKCEQPIPRLTKPSHDCTPYFKEEITRLKVLIRLQAQSSKKQLDEQAAKI